MSKSPYKLYFLWVLGISLFLYPLLNFYTDLSMLVIYLIIINFITFLFYFWDKNIAGGKLTRIPEKILLIMSLFGGIFASIIGQQLFRHKTKKPKFLIWNYLILLLYLILLIVWMAE